MTDGDTTTTAPKTLADKLQATLPTDPAVAWRRYRELLTDNVGDDAQVEELRRLMPILGKRMADVVADQQTIAHVKNLLAMANAGRDLEPEAARAQAAVDAKAAEAQEVQGRLVRELVELRAAAKDVHDRQLSAREACNTIERLKLEQADLLADINPPTL